jgi:predicted transcriptional regulator
MVANATTTMIMKWALLSYKQLKELLVFLTERDLLYYDKEDGTFKTTEKGKRFVDLHQKLVQLMPEEMVPSLRLLGVS